MTGANDSSARNTNDRLRGGLFRFCMNSDRRAAAASMFALVLPVEVLPAVDLALLVEALLVEQLAADLALDAARVPRLVEEVQQEAVEDGAGAPGAVHRHHPER